MPTPMTRQKGRCPVCGDNYADETRLTERIENGDSENIPGTAYDHGDSLLVCIEWADGRTEQN